MEFQEVKDSGKRQNFKTGAVRDVQTGKGRYDLLPTRAIKRLAKHYENGAVKYGDNNWLLGIPLKRMMDSAIRHIFKALEGQTDEDHLTAAAWNILGIIELQERIEEGLLPKELDDLPKLEEDIRPFIEKGICKIDNSEKYKNVSCDLGVACDTCNYNKDKPNVILNPEIEK